MANVVMACDIWGWNHRGKDLYEWFAKDEYTRLTVAYNDDGIHAGCRTKCRIWMQKHLVGEVIIEVVKSSSSLGSYVYFHFSDDEDLTMFKLSHWGKLANEWDRP